VQYFFPFFGDLIALLTKAQDSIYVNTYQIKRDEISFRTVQHCVRGSPSRVCSGLFVTGHDSRA
jgi:hypothetical protein